jgi:hypothetical protein
MGKDVPSAAVDGNQFTAVHRTAERLDDFLHSLVRHKS